MLVVLFLAYPTVTNVAFEAFYCYEFQQVDNTTRRFLTADVRIDCDSAEYNEVLVLAWAALIMVSRRQDPTPPYEGPHAAHLLSAS